MLTSDDVITLPLNPEHGKVVIFSHSPGEEFWLNADVWPMDVNVDEFDEPMVCMGTIKVKFNIKINTASYHVFF